MDRINLDNELLTIDFGSSFNCRIQHVFYRYEITTIRELCKCNIKDLKRFRLLGKASIRQIIEVLKSYGLQLGMSDKQLDEYNSLSPEDPKWEQRRYEIAKEIFLYHVFKDDTGELDYDDITEMSLSIANDFIETSKNVKYHQTI